MDDLEETTAIGAGVDDIVEWPLAGAAAEAAEMGIIHGIVANEM